MIDKHFSRLRGPHGSSGADAPPADDVLAWLSGRLPDDWFVAVPEVTVDREEIWVVGTLPEPAVADGASDADRSAAAAGRIQRFREETRRQRVEVAREAEHRYGRTIAWGAVIGTTRQMFTTLSVPVMTRLRQPERRVLDTLVDGGVARSRSEALAWCVRLVGRHEQEWIDGLREALAGVEEVRRTGPDVR